MKWCRLWHDLANDPKWRTISRISNQPVSSVVSVYVHLLISASTNANERGRTQTNAEDLASALDLQTEHVQAIFLAMQGRVLDENWLTGWEKRQPKREDGSASRASKWREEKKLDKVSKNPNANERTPNANERTRTVLNAPDEDVDEETTSSSSLAAVRNTEQSGKDERDVRTSSTSKSEFLKKSMHEYMAETPGGKFKDRPPDDRIVTQCLRALNGASTTEISEFLRERFLFAQQSPRHSTGPNSYAWFKTVFAERFGGPK